VGFLMLMVPPDSARPRRDMPKTKKAIGGKQAGSPDSDVEPKAAQASKRNATLDRAIQDRIGSHLRAMYDDIKAEPVPERFLDLLQQLDLHGKKP
jgi:Anti-sigma factor NepR